MRELGFPTFDADHHYYEAEDAFIRHVERRMQPRCMQWAEVEGRKRLMVGGRINRFIPNPTFDPVAQPGSLDEFFRGRNPEGKNMRELFGRLEPISPAYRNRDARLEQLDAQGLGGGFFFPTLGVGMQESMRNDPEAACVAFSGFNRWLEEDWGFAFQDRLFAAPYISLMDPAWAAAEVESLVERGARLISMVPGPVPIGDGSRSLADPSYDAVWARINEAGISVAFHAGDAGYRAFTAEAWGGRSGVSGFRLRCPAGMSFTRANPRHSCGVGLPRAIRSLSAASRSQYRVRKHLGGVPAPQVQEVLRAIAGFLQA